MSKFQIISKLFAVQSCACLSEELPGTEFEGSVIPKSNSAEAISIYATESSYYTLSENGMILTIKISKKMLTKQKFNYVL